jgi:hypothetical protein
MAIGVGALCSAPVRRLRKAIPDLIPKKYLDQLHIMEVLMDSRENHKKYRESLKICPSPAVPYFGKLINLSFSYWEIIFIRILRFPLTENDVRNWPLIPPYCSCATWSETSLKVAARGAIKKTFNLIRLSCVLRNKGVSSVLKITGNH